MNTLESMVGITADEIATIRAEVEAEFPEMLERRKAPYEMQEHQSTDDN